MVLIALEKCKFWECAYVALTGFLKLLNNRFSLGGILNIFIGGCHSDFHSEIVSLWLTINIKSLKLLIS